jgi:hypothetical protein
MDSMESNSARRHDLKVGDRVICVGINHDRLFMAQSGTIRELFPPKTDDAGGYVAEPGSDTYLIGA